jgi:hypothetical protein
MSRSLRSLLARSGFASACQHGACGAFLVSTPASLRYAGLSARFGFASLSARIMWRRPYAGSRPFLMRSGTKCSCKSDAINESKKKCTPVSNKDAKS